MWHTPTLRLMLCTVSLMQFCFAGMYSLVPLYADEISSSDNLPQIIYSAIGAGALIGALSVSTIARSVGRSRLLVATLLSGSAALIVASQLDNAVGATLAAFAFGLSVTPAFVTIGTIVQREAPEQYRGRITSIHVAVVGLVFGIAAPLGGYLADQVWGLRTQFLLSGVVLGVLVLAAAITKPHFADLVDGTDPRPTSRFIRSTDADPSAHAG
jgi:ENTS family enterobactin (siderophore) exporter